MDKTNKKIQFKYVFKEDYNPIYANGVYGGVNHKGEFVLNFYQERQAIPNSVVHEVEEDGKLGDVIKKSPEDVDEIMIRYIVAGVTLQYSEAKNIYSWFGKLLKEFEEKFEIPE